MIKKIFAAAVFAALTFSVAPMGAEAATPSDQTSIFKKKKKLVVIKKAKKTNVAKKKQPTQSIFAASTSNNRQKVAKRDCGTFAQCLFGRRVKVTSSQRKVRVARASNSNFGFFNSVGGRKSRRPVDFNTGKFPVGSIIVKTPERALYYVTGPGEAIRYSVGVGREGFQWSGTNRISRKAEWPSWTPPQEMIERELEENGRVIPEFMEGGPGNPLGARALYIGGTIYRIHGTNNEASIGGAVSSGCIRMMNADVIDLYRRVQVGSRIFVYQ